MSNPSPVQARPPSNSGSSRRHPAERLVQRPFEKPGTQDSLARALHENFIGGRWVAPVKGATSTTFHRRRARLFVRFPARRQRMSSGRSACGALGSRQVGPKPRLPTGPAPSTSSRIASSNILPFLAAVETYDNGKLHSVRPTWPTCRSPSTIFDIFAELHPRSREGSCWVSSTTTRWRITSTSRSEWWVRSFPGIFRF